MSSSYIVEPQESGTEKKDDTLIIIVNDDGSLSVDQETLQSLIMNQSNANVSVVRVGQADTDMENGDITLTVDPPAFPPATMNSGGTDATSLVDPFMEMDPEQLERLETALQSEEAKQILGENVTAMLDMLTVEEQQNSIRYSVKLDHCYTSRLSPSDPKPKDPLPIIDSPTSDDGLHYAPRYSPAPGTSKTVSSADTENMFLAKMQPKPVIKTSKPVGRPRKNISPMPVSVCNNSRSSVNITNTPKAVGHPISRNLTDVMQHGIGKHPGRSNEEDEEELTSSSESSESEPSDNDSDFGPRGPRRGGIRARGGRKGLTTRGGSMAATRRRGSNKYMDMEQVRRLDMEMAAAVNAMKTPEKEDKSGGFTFVRGRRQFKAPVGRKKEEPPRIESPSVNEDVSPNFEKPLQTTNQVKANLINANMIKGDMILTKPGQGRNINQKVTFVQKQVLVKPNDLKSVDVKKPLIIPKAKFLSQPGTKFFATKDGKLVQIPVTTKTVTTNVPVTPTKSPVSQVSPTQTSAVMQNQTVNVQQPQPQQPVKVTSPTAVPKIKTYDLKKEKRKTENVETVVTKTEVEPVKTPENKVIDPSKKHPKKDNRKSPAYMVDSLGPALFSTPDIIRRVGSNGDSKGQENVVTSLISSTPPTIAVSTVSTTSVMQATASTSSTSSGTPTRPAVISTPTSSEQTTEGLPESPVAEKQETNEPEQPVQDNEVESKPNLSEDLTPALDSAGIEGEEHLLATLEMEASKHEEELLAEALLLQEELGVDLVENPTLGEQGGATATTSEALASSRTLIIPSLITTEQEATKELDTPAAIITTTMPTNTTTVETTTVVVAPVIATPDAATTVTAPTVTATPVAATPVEVISVAATTVPPITVATTSVAVTSVTMSVVTPTVVATTSAATLQSAKETSKKSAKDDKEPIQIIRGGRVITLPPIEAPATRSKRLQVKTEPVKRTEKPGYNVQTVNQKPSQSVKHETYTSTDQSERNETKIRIREGVNEAVEEDEAEERNKRQIENDEDDDEEEEDNSDSEDDPDRLWCICKRPHNNRFMICCDVCEDWFHGKCVHVSKAMGQQMEEKGIEWVCPNCTKKKEEEAKAKLHVTQNAPGNQRIQSDSDHSKNQNLESVQTSFGDETATSLIQSDNGSTQYSTGTLCVVCKKEARNSSIYCSDACILAHAQETLTKDKPMPGSTASPKGAKSSPSDPISKPKPDARVIVFERRTGRVLTGTDAPTRSNLRTWLKEHPTFEVVGTSNVSSLQLGKIQAVQAQTPNKAGKSPLLSPVKGQNLPKLTYTKVPASKQMILTAGNKKFTVISTGQQQQQQQPSTTKTVQMKQTILTQSNKSPLIFKTTTAKVITPQAKQQVSVAAPKVTPPLKKQEVKQVTVQSKQQQQPQVKPSLPKKPEPEPIRLNIRKTLTELLSSRIKETDDLKLTDEEIAELAFNIELEMYKYFKDTGAKYKAKYRSLVFNIKDTKNLTLFRKIADRSLTPDAVVRLSPDEMASQELAEWREKETKHQLEMIKKNELDLMAQAKSIVVKTHKGEQIIENDGGIDHVDPKTPVQDIVTALNSAENISSTVDDEKDPNKMNDEDRLKLKEEKKSKGSDDKRRKDKEKDRGREKERDKDKDRGKMKDGNRSKTNDRRDRSTSRSRHKRGRDDREHSKTREKSRERKPRDKESKREREKDRDRDRDRDRGPDRPRTRDRDKSKTHESRSREKKQKDKDRDREREKERHRNNENNTRNRNELKDADKKEEDRKRDSEKKDESSMVAEKSTDKSIDDRLWRHVEDEATTNTIDGNDSDVSDREPSSTVTIKTPDINEDTERERDPEPATVDGETTKGGWQTVWRGFVNMVDVAKFFITAQEVSGHAKDLMDDLPDTVDVVGRISHETVWDYISKMKKTGSKEILVIRLTAANDEEKIPYITLYSYLNSRSRLGVVGNVSKNIKDFYIMPFSNQSTLPQVLLPLNGPGFEEHRPHLLLGIIVRNKRKRLAGIPPPSTASMKLSKKDDRSYTPPLVSVSKSNTILGAIVATSIATPTIASSSPSGTATSTYHKAGSSGSVELSKEKQHSVTQTTLDSLNRAHIGMSRNSLLDTAAICKIVPELSSKIDLTSSPGKPAEDDGDEPYSPGQMDEENASALATTIPSIAGSIDGTALDNSIISSSKNSTELQRKMDELNRQIEEQKQQIQSISSSFLGESTTTLPGLGLDPPDDDDCEEAYSPSDTRSFTPPPPGISKFTQPILEKVSNITIPPNLQEILANVKRQESSKVDPYLPSRPSASFLPTAYSSSSTAKHLVSGLNKPATPERAPSETSTHRESAPKEKESKSTLSSLSDLDLIRKAEEELAAVAAASAAAATTEKSASTSLTGASALPTIIGTPPPSLIQTVPGNHSGLPSVTDVSCHETTSYTNPFPEPFKRNIAPEQPKPPGLEDEDFPPFPCTPPNIENNMSKTTCSQSSKFAPKSGIVLSVKRKVSDEGVAPSTPPNKTPRLKSRWGLGPSESDN